MELHSIHISNMKIDGGSMFGVVPKTLWSRKYPADADNLCTWALRSLLIKNGKQQVLIDTGYGDKQSEKFFLHAHIHGGLGLTKALENADSSINQITDVILTHLHADHVGGAVSLNRASNLYYPTFPNARYWVSKSQWEWAIKPNIREAASFLNENLQPLADANVLNFIENEGTLFDNIDVKILNGHTKGQVLPIIRTPEKSVAFMADVIPSTAHIPLLFNMAYEIEPLTGISEKQAFLEEAYKNNYILFFQHDAYTECCTLTKNEKGIIESNRGLLSDFLR